MRENEYKKGFARGFLAAVVLGLVVFGIYGIWQENQDSVLSDPVVKAKLSALEDMIDEDYLDDADKDDLAEGLYAGLIYGLGDPYSRYYTAEEYEEASISTEGSYEGIGVTLQANSAGGVEIIECYQGGPGDEAGLKAGDIISAIDGEDITEKELSEVVSMIRGSGKESTVLTVHRENVDEALEIEVPITNVELPSVFWEMLDDQIGYIQITEFNGNTCEQYETAFAELQDQNMTGLVIDLRDNPGGLLDSVCDILEEILPEGLIVYTEDKNGNREEVTCDGEHPLDIPLAVLVNGESASASEIFAGAVKDYGVGTIVGTTTFGKGIVQSIRVLPDNSAVKLTVSRYYTPNGNNIHGVGIEPDIKVTLDPDLLAKDEITHEEDNQLQAAIAAVKSGE
jgi:carboxyl-terminal processing protease